MIKHGAGYFVKQPKNIIWYYTYPQQEIFTELAKEFDVQFVKNSMDDRHIDIKKRLPEDGPTLVFLDDMQVGTRVLTFCNLTQNFCQLFTLTEHVGTW